ncbi:YihY/virulence factor BrkB family protein [Nocardioides daeguensis]|uniref:YihY/virulence factor BrkB family protein n=1 Tax=Nocardioides daeguensis TaxID=908359 RepID=A0ABP6UZN9_9ACTN|nr:YihY/virulence factor BrkB family protein [Nocardioides daeguensis]MBV6725999.1 YihY/virulence factor BrkB family protein [Nocardioides daeguensis]MCR1772485.1 YihY/virulence factor BrkB family protein [Nocardioides daeguensis]
MTNHDRDADYPGAGAETPVEIPPRGWWQITRRAWREAKADQVPLMAAGVAFYSFLALFPAMIAGVLLYGLVRDPQDVEAQVRDLGRALPADATSLLTDQLRAIASTPQQSLGLGLIVSLVLALWSASGGVGNMVTAINVAYDEEETRGFVKRKLLSLGLTLGAIVFVVVALTLVAAAPAVLDDLIGSGPQRWLLEGLRWLGLVAVMTVMLALLYRLAPDRDDPRLSWVSVGASVATVIWVVASLGFSLYVNSFGSYNETYGALAGVVILLLWLWLTMFVVLLGAEVNAEAEQQTVTDTTVGPPRPLGERHAVKADTLPGERVPDRAEPPRRQGEPGRGGAPTDSRRRS